MAAPGSCPAPAPQELPAETVSSPAYPTPGRVWWRPRRRRAQPVSGSAVTRAALAPPRATSPAPRAGPLSFRQTKGPRDAAEPAGPGPGAPGWRAEGGGGGHKAAFVAPCLAHCGGLSRPRRCAGRAPPPAPPRARRGRGRRCLPPPTATPQFRRPLPRSQPPPAGPRAVARLPPASLGPIETAGRGGGEGTPGSEQRRPRGWGGGGRGTPAGGAAVRRILTGICLLIEDCGLIIQPVPRRRRHRRRR